MTYLKRDCGLRYNPEYTDPASTSPLGYRDSKDLLINGLLSDQHTGTCNSIPVIVVAVGRRLGYPLFLVTNGAHVWARWDEGRERFNIEASNPGGFAEHADDYYRHWPRPMSEAAIRSGYYLRNFTPADELAMFLFSRAWVLESHLRFEESLPIWAKCCFLAPTEPMYPRRAYLTLIDAMYRRKTGKLMPREGMNRMAKVDVTLDAQELLTKKLVAVAASIGGHFHEVRQEAGNALVAYKSACDTDPTNPDYQADRERFVAWLEAKTIETERKAWQILKGSEAASNPVAVQSTARAPRKPSASPFSTETIYSLPGRPTLADIE